MWPYTGPTCIRPFCRQTCWVTPMWQLQLLCFGAILPSDPSRQSGHIKFPTWCDDQSLEDLNSAATSNRPILNWHRFTYSGLCPHSHSLQKYANGPFFNRWKYKSRISLWTQKVHKYDVPPPFWVSTTDLFVKRGVRRFGHSCPLGIFQNYPFCGSSPFMKATCKIWIHLAQGWE